MSQHHTSNGKDTGNSSNHNSAGLKLTLDAAASPPVCPISFVAGGNNCSVADASQSTHLQPRENEPWRTYSELMYSGAFPADLTLKYLQFASNFEKGMKVGMLSGTGPSCCGNQLMSFTSHGFGAGLLQHGLVDRYLLMLYTASQHGCTRGTWVCGESSSIDRNQSTVDYATPAQLTVPLLLKWAMYETLSRRHLVDLRGDTDGGCQDPVTALQRGRVVPPPYQCLLLGWGVGKQAASSKLPSVYAEVRDLLMTSHRLYDEPMNKTLWITPAAPREWLLPNSNRTIEVNDGPSRYDQL